MTVIGITGPTGAGKTTVLDVLRDMGGAVADCDGVYHELLSTSVPMREELAARFGPEIFDENGDLRRKELGAIVFGDPDALADLNAITHRHIVSELERRIAQAEGEGRPAIALDAVALLEVLDVMKLEGGVPTENLPKYLLGMAVAAVVGFFSIHLVRLLADRGRFGAFAFYCWGAGALFILLNIMGWSLVPTA